MKIILASKSPRRVELLQSITPNFEIIPSDKDEDMNKHLSICELSKNLAKQKAQDIFENTSGNRTVIGSDTIVVYKNKLYGKPKNKDEAFKMLKTLSGKTHKVITSLCILIENNGEIKEYLTYDMSKVTFINLTDDMINEYLTHDEYKDKAGSYAVQGIFAKFIKKINGSYATVMGLPIHLVYDVLHKECLI